MKKLSVMILMAATMLAACNESDTRRDQPEAGEPGYISTNGEGVDVNEVEIDRTSNATTEESIEEAVTPEEAEETRLRKKMNEEHERIGYWTLDESALAVEGEAIKESLDQMDKNFNRIDADISNIETGTYNREGRLSREGQSKLKEVRQQVAEAKRINKQAYQRYNAGKYEEASDKLEKVNEKLAEARETYIEAIEKETGVEMEVENENKVM